jgi:hypothetical protein
VCVHCAAHSGFSLGPRGSSCPLASPSGLSKTSDKSVAFCDGPDHKRCFHTASTVDTHIETFTTDRHFQCFSGFCFSDYSFCAYFFSIGLHFDWRECAGVISNRSLLHKHSAMMTLMPYLESGSTIPSSTASRLDLDDDQLVDNSHRQVHVCQLFQCSCVFWEGQCGIERKISRQSLVALSRTMNVRKITSLL